MWIKLNDHVRCPVCLECPKGDHKVHSKGYAILSPITEKSARYRFLCRNKHEICMKCLSNLTEMICPTCRVKFEEDRLPSVLRGNKGTLVTPITPVGHSTLTDGTIDDQLLTFFRNTIETSYRILEWTIEEKFGLYVYIIVSIVWLFTMMKIPVLWMGTVMKYVWSMNFALRVYDSSKNLYYFHTDLHRVPILDRLKYTSYYSMFFEIPKKILRKSFRRIFW